MAGPPPPAGERPRLLRWLIVNGDDLGLTAGINGGIERAFRDGILRSASVMAVGAALGDAGERVRRLPGLGVGLHLTLVGERPLCRPEEVPSLVGSDGLFLRDYRAFLSRYLRGGLRACDVRREFQAQAAAVAALGVPLDHLDSHQHLHLLPGLTARTLELAREHGIRWVRAPRPLRRVSGVGSDGSDGSGRTPDTRRPTPLPQRPLAERLMFAVASAWARGRLARSGFPLTRGSLGFDCSGHLTSGYLLRHLSNLPAGVTELICHPGEGDAETQAQYPAWGYQWRQELEALTDPVVRNELERCGVCLASFAAVSGAGS